LRAVFLSLSLFICFGAEAALAQDRLREQVDSALTYLTAGDTTRAMRAIRAAYHLEPCLIPHDSILPVPRWREIFDWARPRDQSCSPNPALATFTSAVFPGMTQIRLGHPRKGLIFSGVSILGVGSGLYLLHRSSINYGDYQLAFTPESATEFYDRALIQKRAGITALGVGGAAWLLNIIDANRTAIARRAEINRVRPYASINTARTGVGVAFTF
jgi:hypothetical protein